LDVFGDFDFDDFGVVRGGENTDLTASFESGDADVGGIFGSSVGSHRFGQIFFSDAIVPRIQCIWRRTQPAAMHPAMA